MYLGLVTEHDETRGLKKASTFSSRPLLAHKRLPVEPLLELNWPWSSLLWVRRATTLSRVPGYGLYHDPTRENQEFCKKKIKVETHKQSLSNKK